MFMAKHSGGLSVVSRLNIVYGKSKTARSAVFAAVSRAAFLRARARLAELENSVQTIKAAPRNDATDPQQRRPSV
jgi:hypothetical protein